MHPYEFRAATEKDLPLIKRWLASVPWQEWRGDPDQELADITAYFESDSVEPLIVELKGDPIAYVETYDPHLEDDHRYRDQPFGTLGVEISIGENKNFNFGHGTNILTALSELLFEEGAVRLIIDPHPNNSAALRCFEKAGFVRFDTRTSKRGPALMMALDNPELFEKET